MDWYNNLFGNVNKANPAQQFDVGKKESSKEPTTSYTAAYEQLEIVNRGVNMVVDDSAEIPTIVKPHTHSKGVISGIKRAKVEILLNREPNPYQDINCFRRNLITDFILDGNIFIYYDGAYMYHLPSDKVVIHADEDTYISHYSLNDVKFTVDEIIHVKENSFESIYRGVPRLKPAHRTMKLMLSMRNFQDNFFKNGAVPGLVLKTDNTLSDKIKERMILSWQQRYRPDAGGRRPLILDGGISVDSLSDVNFKDLDFQNSIADNEKIILKALGVPPILLDSGNNANIRPNLRLYYLETILPIVRKINFAMTRFYGFECVEDITDIPALQPELSDASAYYTSLVNGGIITPAEAREKLGFPRLAGTETIRVPANIAGSAADPSVGGRPSEGENDE
jgi:HK97 family phage portal protein